MGRCRGRIRPGFRHFRTPSLSTASPGCKAKTWAVRFFGYDKEEEERKLRKAEYEAGVADGLNTAKKDAAIAFAELHVPIEQIALALKVDVEAVKKWLRETGK